MMLFPKKCLDMLKTLRIWHKYVAHMGKQIYAEG